MSELTKKDENLNYSHSYSCKLKMTIKRTIIYLQRYIKIMEEKKQFQVKASLDEFNYIFNYIRKISNEVRIVFHDYVFNYYALCYVNRCKFFSRIFLFSPRIVSHD